MLKYLTNSTTSNKPITSNTSNTSTSSSTTTATKKINVESNSTVTLISDIGADQTQLHNRSSSSSNHSSSSSHRSSSSSMSSTSTTFSVTSSSTKIAPTFAKCPAAIDLVKKAMIANPGVQEDWKEGELKKLCDGVSLTDYGKYPTTQERNKALRDGRNPKPRRSDSIRRTVKEYIDTNAVTSTGKRCAASAFLTARKVGLSNSNDTGNAKRKKLDADYASGAMSEVQSVAHEAKKKSTNLQKTNYRIAKKMNVSILDCLEQENLLLGLPSDEIIQNYFQDFISTCNLHFGRGNSNSGRWQEFKSDLTLQLYEERVSEMYEANFEIISTEMVEKDWGVISDSTAQVPTSLTMTPAAGPSLVSSFSSSVPSMLSVSSFASSSFSSSSSTASTVLTVPRSHKGKVYTSPKDVKFLATSTRQLFRDMLPTIFLTECMKRVRGRDPNSKKIICWELGAAIDDENGNAVGVLEGINENGKNFFFFFLFHFFLFFLFIKTVHSHNDV